MADPELLMRIAREDGDPAVRRVAFKKIHDADALVSLAGVELDDSLKRLALERASQIRIAAVVSASDAPSALAALEKLTSPAQLAEVTRTAAAVEVARAAL